MGNVLRKQWRADIILRPEAKPICERCQIVEIGKGYVCMHSTLKNDTISRIKLHLAPGSVVTTSKNYADNIVTEYLIARLHGKSLSERAKALISIAHPKLDELERDEGIWIDSRGRPNMGSLFYLNKTCRLFD